MSHRCLAAVFVVIVAVVLTPMFTTAQSTSALPRTPWGDPDL